MPLASLAALQWYGPGMLAAEIGSVAPSASADLRGVGRAAAVDVAVTSSPRAFLISGRYIYAVGQSTSYAISSMKGTARMGAVGKVNELSQDDVTGAVLESKIEGDLTLKQSIRLLLAISQGLTTITDLGGGNATVRFRDVANVKDRLVFSMEGSERVAVTRDPT